MAVGEGRDVSPERCQEILLDSFQDTDGEATVEAVPYRSYFSTGRQYVPGRGMERYRPALKNLIPVRKKSSQNATVVSVDSAGIVSSMTFSWISSLMYQAFSRGIAESEMPICSPLDTCSYNSQRLEMLWQQEMAKHGRSNARFRSAVWKFVRTRFWAATLLSHLSIAFGFISATVCLRELLEYSQDKEAQWTRGAFWACGLMVTEILRTMLLAWSYSISYRTSMRLRSACMAMLFRKLLRLNSLGDSSVGQLINIFASDSQRIYDMMLSGPLLLGGPLLTIAGLAYIYWLLGRWALLGMTSFLLFYPLLYGISNLVGHLRGRMIRITDERVHLMSEILNCIKFIKMYAWESSFERRINEIRARECAVLQKTAYCQSLNVSMAPTLPVVSAIITFVVHTAAGHSLSAAETFPVLYVLCVLTWRWALRSWGAVRRLRHGLASLSRVQAFSLLTFLTKQARSALNLCLETFTVFFLGIVSLQRLQAYSLVSILNNLLRNSWNMSQLALSNFFEANVAFNRIESLLLLDDLTMYIARPIDRSHAVCMGGATFQRPHQTLDENGSSTKKKEMQKDAKYGSGKDPERKRLNQETGASLDVLKDISIEIPKGQLVGICGTVGCGKSSLLLALLGQMRLTQGNVTRDGTCAYVSQEAWALDISLRDNVTFGEAFDAKRYYDALHCCCLNEDVAILPGGDAAFVGERGSNLSGGQRQRMALARAVYANRDIYLLDDPLSAVDVHVSTQIFERCILGALKSKTVVLVTNQLQLLSRCEQVLLLKSGLVAERGSHSELMAANQDYAALVGMQMSNATTNNNNNNNGESTGPCSVESEVVGNNGGDAIATRPAPEGVPGRGAVSLETYASYVTAAGGTLVAVAVAVSFLLNIGSAAFSSWWLAIWIKEGSGNANITVANNGTRDDLTANPNFDMYQTVYASTIGLILGTSLLRGYVFTKAILSASKKLHSRLFNCIIHAPMSYFDSTPIGRVQNLFSRDLDEVDSCLPLTVESIMQNICMIFFTLLFLSLVFPWVMLPLACLAIVYYFISKVFRVAVRDLKRMECESRSPIYSLVDATVQGIATVKAFGKEADFMSRFTRMFDENSMCIYLCSVATRWLAVRLDFLAVCITGVTSALVVALHGEVAPALAGLALSYAMHITGMLQYTLRLISDTEARFIAVERIVDCLHNTEQEEAGRIPIKPAADWPNKGGLTFEKVSLRYRPGLPNVLKSVSFSVRPGEKIGIAGRTGSGKSSLVTALFRLSELSEGRIVVDGENISALGLRHLRGQLSVVPQDPVLFDGSIRWNLDPEGRHDDQELWDALSRTRLLARVTACEGQLDAPCLADSLSLGERQLLCLARALLRHTKVLVLDEASAAIDADTEQAVAATVSAAFAECTVLSIAHRLGSIVACDRVLIMGRGQIVEYDTPANLTANPNSAFSRMLARAD